MPKRDRKHKKPRSRLQKQVTRSLSARRNEGEPTRNGALSAQLNPNGTNTTLSVAEVLKVKEAQIEELERLLKNSAQREKRAKVNVNICFGLNKQV